MLQREIHHQELPEYGISGKRNTQIRWDAYKLDRFLTNKETALELGCNVGFFSALLSRYVKELHGYDINNSYINVAKFFTNYLQQNNCSFDARDVKNLSGELKYDIIISCAVHGWSGLDFSSYCKMLLGFSKPNAILLFESHEILVEKDWPQKKAFLFKFCDYLDAGFIDDVDNRYASEIREYLILKIKTDAVIASATIKKRIKLGRMIKLPYRIFKKMIKKMIGVFGL